MNTLEPTVLTPTSVHVSTFTAAAYLILSSITYLAVNSSTKMCRYLLWNRTAAWLEWL